ncbi:unnamed protein product [Tetraodon nigroviridis]|uniref:(spotted green pufferfish) hypothetical protein n=1 Tax=Tetraodon nigroviridis TaxID=99883 RepID=Q4SWI5_TETNG|nr:unnamed protein product [Tetraodon nigroviridis]
MRIQGQPEGARRRLDLGGVGELRSVEIIRGRAGYGFTISGQRPCLLSGIQEGSPADVVGLKQGDQIMAINGTDVSVTLHETVVQLIGSCKGPLQMVVQTEGRKMKNPILNDAKFGIVQKNEIYQKAGILRTISDDSNNSSFNSTHAVPLKQRPASEPDVSQWCQHWNPFVDKPTGKTCQVGDGDAVFTEGEGGNPDWNMLNITLVVGYLSSTELILNTSGSEDDCSRAILERIRQLGTEQNTHTLVMMKIICQIPSNRSQSGEVKMLPPREEWTKHFLEQRDRQRKDFKNGSRFWGMGGIRASKRRSAKRLSLARSLDDLEAACVLLVETLKNNESQEEAFLQENLELQHNYSGVQLQGCCSQSSLNSNGSLPGGGGHRGVPEQRVTSWSTCFEQLLQDPVGVRYFTEFLKKEFSEENILFWQACEYFSHVPATDKKQLSQRAGEIYNSFLSSKATMPVNIDSQAQLADDVLTSPRPDMFKTQQLQIFNLMKFDSYSRFLKSSLYQECVHAEQDGRSLPDPYQIPCSPAPSKHSASSDRSTLSTPKKEARKQRSGRSLNEDAREESADKKRGIFFSWSRNRSFGKGPKKKDIGDINLGEKSTATSTIPNLSLWMGKELSVSDHLSLCWYFTDYWGSNGRRESQGSLSSGTSLEMATSCKTEGDNRHSVGPWERPPRQCSVMLPDGSCSSITLRSGSLIREVLQDLCQNIGVNIAAVDLFLVGGEKPLVLDQDCMTLCSRDLRLEKRTLFRLDLVPINRSVGLKAKPTKPVTEVLRPVVAKYGLHLGDLVAKISGETEPLDLGAPISSLDGLRVVLERADPVSGKDKSKSSSLKGHPPTRSFSATSTLLLLHLQADDRAAAKDFSGRAGGPDSALPGEKRKQKKINIDEAEEFFELLSRAQSARANDQRGLLRKEDLVLPDFLRLSPPGLACSTPDSLKQARENGAPRGDASPPASARRAWTPPSAPAPTDTPERGGTSCHLPAKPLRRRKPGPWRGAAEPGRRWTWRESTWRKGGRNRPGPRTRSSA